MLYRIVYECGEQHYNAYELTYYYYSTSSFVVRLATLEALQSRSCDLLSVLYFWRRDFYVFFERLFCFYTPPHTLRAFRTAIKRIDDLAFGVFANRPWAEDWKIRFKPPQFTPSFLYYRSAEGPLPWHKPPTSRLDTSTRFYLFRGFEDNLIYVYCLVHYRL